MQALQIQAGVDASGDGRAYLYCGTLFHADNPILVGTTHLAHLAYGLGVFSGGRDPSGLVQLTIYAIPFTATQLMRVIPNEFQVCLC